MTTLVNSLSIATVSPRLRNDGWRYPKLRLVIRGPIRAGWWVVPGWLVILINAFGQVYR